MTGAVLSGILSVLMRWLHIVSVIVLLGGFFYSRVIVTPSLLGADSALGQAIMARSWPWIRRATYVIVLSGIYNLVTKSNIPLGYQMWFGIKMLFALHILAVSLVITRPSILAEKRTRLTTGILLSGSVATIIAAYLRFLSNWMMS